jgi:hypothetical protein
MDQHHWLPGAVDQAIYPDAARIEDLRLDRTGGTGLAQQDDDPEQKASQGPSHRLAKR